jgi:hypothetical protein
MAFLTSSLNASFSQTTTHDQEPHPVNESKVAKALQQAQELNKTHGAIPSSLVISDGSATVSVGTSPEITEQMVVVAMKQAQDLNQIHNKKNSPLSSDNNFNSSPIKSGSSPSTSDPISRANLALNHASSNEDKTSSSGGVTSKQTACFRNAIVDEMVDGMVTEALNYAQDAKENSNCTPFTTGNIPSFHSNRTDHSEDGVSARSNYSQTDSSNSRHNVFFEC